MSGSGIDRVRPNRIVVRVRNRQLIRTLQLRQLLASERWTLGALSKRLGVSKRTVYRDIAALQEAHEPVVKVGTDDEWDQLWTIRGRR